MADMKRLEIPGRELRTHGRAKPIHADRDQIVVEVVSRRQQNDGLDPDLAGSGRQRIRRALADGIGVRRDIEAA